VFPPKQQAFAGHFKLDNLILIYDSNDVTLDAMASATQSEDTAKRFEAYGFAVQTVDGHNMIAFLEAFQKAKAATGKPQFIVARTIHRQRHPGGCRHQQSARGRRRKIRRCRAQGNRAA
jgi:transketolase